MGQTVIHGALDHAELLRRGLRPETLLDFSSNVNPFGPPHVVRAALAALDPAPYPDRSCLALRQQFATRHGCDAAQVLVGNGSNELIHLLARALLRPGARALVVAPTFAEYAHAGRLAHADVAEWRTPASPPFGINVAAVVARIGQLRPRLTWLCSPNNPTGVEVAPAQLAELALACSAHDGVLVVDRAYAALRRGDEGAGHDTTVGPILWLHSLTKSYALAGLRLGYVLGDAALLNEIGRHQPSWSVNSAAQAAGAAVLADPAFLPDTLARWWAASDTLMHGVEQLGFPTWRDALPFLLVHTGNGAATRDALLGRGCVVRDCASFGLPSWVRVAPRRAEENARLLAAWKDSI